MSPPRPPPLTQEEEKLLSTLKESAVHTAEALKQAQAAEQAKSPKGLAGPDRRSDPLQSAWDRATPLTAGYYERIRPIEQQVEQEERQIAALQGRQLQSRGEVSILGPGHDRCMFLCTNTRTRR